MTVRNCLFNIPPSVANAHYSDINENVPDGFEQTDFEDDFFTLPDLSFGQVESPPTPNSSRDSTKEEIPTVDEIEQVHDIWNFSKAKSLTKAKYLSWDSFRDEAFQEPYTCYISESGPRTFDAALADHSDPLHVDNGDSVVIQSNTYAASLLALGLGRSSVLFSWNEDQRTFEPKLKSMRVPGCTRETVDSVLAIFLKCGNTTKALQAFVDGTYAKNNMPGRIALADAVATLLKTATIPS